MNRLYLFFCLAILVSCDGGNPDPDIAPEEGSFSVTLQGKTYRTETQGTYSYDTNFRQSQVEIELADADLTVVVLTLSSDERDENFFTEGSYPGFGDKSSGVVAQIAPGRTFYSSAGSTTISQSDTVIDVISGTFSYTLVELGDTTSTLQVSGSFDNMPVR